MQLIKNIGILAHVDAGKTTLTEQLLYHSGSVQKAGRVDLGTTTTDSMALEKERGITIRANSASLTWEGQKINLIDTPGHMDFITEVERIFRILEGAVLVLSAKEGVQSQTKAIFHHLRRLQVPTLILINKIDRVGTDIPQLLLQIKSMLSSDLVIMQEQTEAGIISRPLQHDDIQVELFAHSAALQERFLANQPITESELSQTLREAVERCELFPVFYASALKSDGIVPILNAIARWLPHYHTSSNSFSGYVYKVDRDDLHLRRSYVKILSGELNVRDIIPSVKTGEMHKITVLETFSEGCRQEVKQVPSGDIAILPYTRTLQIGDYLGHLPNLDTDNLLRQKAVFKASVVPLKPGERADLLNALVELTEEDPDLHFSIEGQEEVTIQLLGNTQKEVIQSLLAQRYGIETTIGKLNIIYMERPQKTVEAVIHIGVSPNPFYASIGLCVEPLPIGSGIQFESKVSLGYLNPPFQHAVRDGVLTACKHGLLGWELTDARITFTYGKYFSPISTPSDFRRLAPHVLEMALRQSGTGLLEPVCSYTLEIPEPCIGRAMHDIQLMRGTVNGITAKSDGWHTLSGHVPMETARNYALDVVSYTEGAGIFFLQHMGYAQYDGEPVSSHWKSNDGEQLRHQFLKAEQKKI